MADIIMEPEDVTKAIDNFIDKMKTVADGQIDKKRYYWYNWALREAFKAGMEYEKFYGTER